MGATGGNVSLEDLRQAAGLSVQQVAASGLSPVTYSLLERGQFDKDIPATNWCRLAVIFGVTEAEVLVAAQVSRDRSRRT